MRTRITDLCGIECPIVLSGMSWISVPSMVAAVSNAGGLGLLATGPLSVDATREAIREIRSLTDKPFGANVTLLFPGAVENARVLLEEQVPVINYSLGKGDWIVKNAHGYGGRVMATVVNERHARRAQEQGADALVVTGHEAAAHGGDVTSLVLIPRIVDIVDLPVIAAGGIADGRGLAAALALGAEGVAMGTRFMTTRESPLHDISKEAAIRKGIEETIYGRYFDGLGCRSLLTAAARKAYRRGIAGLPNFFTAARTSVALARLFHMSYFKLFFGVLLSGWKTTVQMAYMANAFTAIQRATIDGDLAGGVLPSGQAVGLLGDMPTVQELLDRMVHEAEISSARLEVLLR